MVEKSQIQSVEELMEYVESHAKKRVKQLSKKYKQLADITTCDNVILQVLKDSGEPLSVDLISFLTGINKSRCCQILNRLSRKWKAIRKVTVCETAYYTVA